MVFLEFLVFLVFLETSEVVGPGPNPREIDISFGAEGPLACARPDPTIGWTDVLPCVFVCVWGRYPPAAVLNNYFSYLYIRQLVLGDRLLESDQPRAPRRVAPRHA